MNAVFMLVISHELFEDPTRMYVYVYVCTYMCVYTSAIRLLQSLNQCFMTQPFEETSGQTQESVVDNPLLEVGAAGGMGVSHMTQSCGVRSFWKLQVMQQL